VSAKVSNEGQEMLQLELHLHLRVTMTQNSADGVDANVGEMASNGAYLYLGLHSHKFRVVREVQEQNGRDGGVIHVVIAVS
jgi:hypothetical protein